LGLSANTGCIGQLRPRLGTQHDPEHSESARHRASSATSAEDDLEGVPAKTLGADRGQRLLQHGSLEGIWFGLVGRLLFYETIGMPCRHWVDPQAKRMDCRRFRLSGTGSGTTYRDCVTHSATASRKHIHGLIPIIGRNQLSERSKTGCFCSLHLQVKLAT